MTDSFAPNIIVLAGGKGTRLASVVSDVPKPLAPVLGRPFLDYLLIEIARSNLFKSVTLSLGHQADKVISHYQTHKPPLPVQFVVEDTPLGTGGGMRYALENSQGLADNTFILNGDSFVQIPFKKMLSFHLAQSKIGCFGLVTVPDCNRFGQVQLVNHVIEKFLEKTPSSQPGLINAGVYLFKTASFLKFASKENRAFSLEMDLIPKFVQSKSLVGFEIISPFIDIGLPETYEQAGAFLREFGNKLVT